MFEKIGNGFRILGSTLKFTFKHPVFLIPFLFSFILIAVADIAIYMYLPTETTTTWGYVGIGVLLLFVTSFFLAIAQLVLLELLEQHEKFGELNLFKAIKEALTRDLFRALPIIIVWSLIQYIFAILEALVSGNSENSRRRPNILARLLRGVKKGLGWGVMLSYAAIAWEDDLKPGQAVSKARKVYSTYFVEMLTGVSISGIVSLIGFLPIIIIFIANIQLSAGLLIAMLVWVVIVMALGRIVEQMYTAELYLWYKSFEDQANAARRNGEDGPKSLYEVEKPSFFDDIPSFEY